MTNQRPLNTIEREILMRKNQRLGKEIDIAFVEYVSLFPRSTLCTITVSGNDALEVHMGISMRAKNEPNIPVIGEHISFTRAINQAAGVKGY